MRSYAILVFALLISEQAMIESWRRRWRTGDFAFLFVQV